MSYTWGELRQLYLNATEGDSHADREWWMHATFALRQLSRQLEVAECFQPDARVSISENEDCVDLDCNVYHIHTVVDMLTGRKINPEPEGFRGRQQYIENSTSAQTGRPPKGALAFWVRNGRKLYLRDTADADRDLQISYRFHPAELTELDKDKHSFLPMDHDQTLLQAALESFYSLHPKTDEGATGDRASLHGKRVMQLTTQRKSPPAEEQRDRRDYTKAFGYSFNVRV